MAKVESGDDLARAATFNTTHWSVVLAAAEHQSDRSITALEKLCRAYWYPLYLYVRRQGHNREDAEDLTQNFFSRFLSKNYVAKADRNRGKFRTFLLGSLKNFIVNEWRRAGRLKRGGTRVFVPFDAGQAEGRYAAEPMAEGVPESLYDKQWAVAVVEQVFVALHAEYASADKGDLLEELKGFVWGERNSASYTEIASKLNIEEGTVRVSVHRLRQRFRELLRQEVAETVASPEEIDGELRHLISVLSR